MNSCYFCSNSIKNFNRIELFQQSCPFSCDYFVKESFVTSKSYLQIFVSDGLMLALFKIQVFPFVYLKSNKYKKMFKNFKCTYTSL